ncbi:membrane-spanning 4-domains subfamily A member 12 isoform X2 [Sapajus apella]|uniref:Membrane-spanning 4-domains subfamily A member 12 isoform X2 n=1 Tax=Sapajus apella TaxID=9515 RepID=A0A6J3I9G4_SAPAP|nr:membrane-spanning 4-domains subfamily A member 12 isoform X2 [Sapajus apella]
MSSKPTSHAGVHETIPSPYPPSSFLAPGSQQPLGSINSENQAQDAQYAQPCSTRYPETSAGSQLGQGNTRMINSSMGMAVITFKEEAKALGVIQIMIGLMHLGFGIILGLISFLYKSNLSFLSLAFVGGYPFWGGLSLRSSLGMNITSSIFAFIGVILLLTDMCINGGYYQDYWAVLSGKGISAMLMIFSLLEFFTACVTAHFAYQTITITNMSVLAAPTVYANNPFIPESSSAPPRYNDYSTYTPRY